MPDTPIYALPFETNPTDAPGHSLHGGLVGTDPILAEAVETELARIDAAAAVVGDIVLPAYSTYTPTFTGIGTATFSSLVGRFKRIAVNTMHWRVHAVVGTAGSGSSNVQIDSPTNPDRTGRQVVMMHVERTGFPGNNLVLAQVIAFSGGGGVVWDRIRWAIDGDGTNMVGSDLVADAFLTIEGVYEEAA